MEKMCTERGLLLEDDAPASGIEFDNAPIEDNAATFVNCLLFMEIPFVGFNSVKYIYFPKLETVNDPLYLAVRIRSAEFFACLYTTCLPTGMNAAPASLKWAMPNGIPIMVMQKNKPVNI